MRFLALLSFLLLLAAPFRVQAADHTADFKDVTLQLKWTHQFQFAGYYAAIAKGYYRDVGLRVKLRAYEFGKTAGQAVVDGHADFGVGATDLLLMRAAGHPVVVLSNVFQHSPVALAVRADTNIENIHQLMRGKVMMDADSAEILAYFHSEGIDSLQIKSIPHEYRLGALAEPGVDAMSVYTTNEPFLLKQLGIGFSLLKPIESGIDFYGDNLFTTENMISEKPDLVRAFKQASMKGWHYAMANQEEIIDLIVERYNGSKSKDHLRFEASRMQDLILDDVIPVGFINPLRWQRIADRYKDANMLEKDFSIDGFIHTPDVARDLSIYYQIIGAMLAAGSILALLLLWYRKLNNRLRIEVFQREQAQRELTELNHQKDRFFTIVAHDLRGGFNDILPTSWLLASRIQSLSAERVGEYAAAIHDGAQKTFDLLENLLEWARMQMGQVDFDLQLLPLREVAEASGATVMTLAQRKQITITNTIAPTCEAYADKEATATILRNLLSNAIKFTPEGGDIRIDAARVGDEVEVLVRDSGVGIAADKLAKLWKLEETYVTKGTNNEPGTGLGLLIVRELVEEQGGEITVSSTPGKGSVFRFTLPFTNPVTQTPE